jgi:RNA polymerase sigma factor (sigma-70 family)
VEKEDLRSIGLVALIENPTPDIALAWTVAYRAMVRYLERSEYKHQDGRDESTDENLHGRAARAQDLDSIRELVRRLRPAWREVLECRVTFGMTWAETAEKMELSEESVRQTYSRATKALREAWNSPAPATKDTAAAPTVTAPSMVMGRSLNTPAAAWSLNVPPDRLPSGQEEALCYVIASTVISCCPEHPLYFPYSEAAARHRDRITC